MNAVINKQHQHDHSSYRTSVWEFECPRCPYFPNRVIGVVAGIQIPGMKLGE
jgi:hypothetical protein